MQCDGGDLSIYAIPINDGLMFRSRTTKWTFKSTS